MPETFSFFPVFLVMVAASAVPGPSDLLVVATTLEQGLRGSLRVIAGILLGDALFIVLASLGLLTLTTLAPGLGFSLRLAGYAYLLYLSGRLYSCSGTSGAAAPATSKPGLIAGFTITLSDPTAIGFYAALLPVLTGGKPIRVSDGFILFACAVCAVSLVKIGYSLLALRLRETKGILSRSAGLRRGLAIVFALLTIGMFLTDLINRNFNQ